MLQIAVSKRPTPQSIYVIEVGVQLACNDCVQPDGANDNRVAADAPLAEGALPCAVVWHQVADPPPVDRELLLWVYGPFVGQWDAVDGIWVDKTSREPVCPVRFWAYITPP